MAAAQLKKLSEYRDKLKARLKAGQAKANNTLVAMLDEKEQYMQRGERAGLHAAAAGGTAAVLGYALTTFPKMQYIDKDKKIETHALLAIAAPLAGIAAYASGHEDGDLILAAGNTVLATFVFQKSQAYAAKRLAAKPAAAA